jgi:hypothetical protein
MYALPASCAEPTLLPLKETAENAGAGRGVAKSLGAAESKPEPTVKRNEPSIHTLTECLKNLSMFFFMSSGVMKFSKVPYDHYKLNIQFFFFLEP